MIKKSHRNALGLKILLSAMIFYLAILPFASASNLYENFSSPSSADNFFVHTTQWMRQSFTMGTVGPNQNIVTNYIAIHAEKNAGGLTYMNVSIYNATGSLLGRNSTANTNIGTAGWYNIYISGVNLTASQSYNITFTSSDGDGTNNIGLFGILSDGYAGGEAKKSADNGATWTSTSAWDVDFSVYGMPDCVNYVCFITENSQTFNTPVLSATSQLFKVNITYNSSAYTNILGYLVYNNTEYVAAKYGSGNSRFETTIIVPSVSANTNKQFYWKFQLSNSTTTIFANSTSNTQTINPIGIDDCTTFTNLTLNYTMKDEITQAVFNGTYQNATIEADVQLYPIGSDMLITEFSKVYSNASNARICLQNALGTSQYRIYSQIKYYASGYVTRYNYLQNFTIQSSTIPQNINLFDLETSKATKFTVSYKDSQFLQVADALIIIARRYVGEAASKTVEIEKTDNTGQSIAYFDLNGVIYSITVSKEGQLLSSFDNIAIRCQDTLGNCVINLDASAAFNSATNFDTYRNLNYATSFNKTSRVYTLTFNTLDNSVSLFSINLTQFDAYSNITLCSNQVMTSSGSLSCTIPGSYNNVTFTATTYMDGNVMFNEIYSITPDAVESFAGNLIIFLIAITLTFAAMFIPSAIGVIIGSLIAVLFSVILLFTSGSAFGGAFIILVIVGFIIIWRIRSGGSD